MGRIFAPQGVLFNIFEKRLEMLAALALPLLQAENPRFHLVRPVHALQCPRNRPGVAL